jgi:hypothetical protein
MNCLGASLFYEKSEWKSGEHPPGGSGIDGLVPDKGRFKVSGMERA